MRALQPRTYTRLLLAAAALAVMPTRADAAALYWDGTDAVDGGNGDWDTSSQNWDLSAAGGANTAWSNSNPDSATFAGTAGTVNLLAGITTSGLTFDTAGYTLAGNAITLASGAVIAANQNATISAHLAGASGLTKSGNGSLTLSGINSFTGTTTVNAGMLTMGANTVRSSWASGNGTYVGGTGSPSTLAADATSIAGLTAANFSSIVMNGAWLGNYTPRSAAVMASSFTNNGSTITFWAATNDSGTTKAVKLQVTKDAGGNFVVAQTDARYRTGDYTGSADFTADITGAGSNGGVPVGSDGYGVSNIAFGNVVTGYTVATGGTLNLNGKTIAAGAVSLTGGTISGAGTLTGTSYSLESGAVSAVLAGAVNLTKSTSGTVTLSGANTYSGTTTVSNGTLEIGGAGTLGTSATYDAAVAINGASSVLKFNSSAGTTLRGDISGTGTLRNDGAGVLTLSAAVAGRAFAGTLIGGNIKIGTSTSSFYGITGSMSGLNGAVTISGKVYHSGSGLGSASAAFTQESGSEWLIGNDDAANVNTTFAMGSLAGTGLIAGSGYNPARTGAKTISVGALGTDTTYSGSIRNAFEGGGSTVALTKVGSGALTLSGTNTYSGGTVVSAGSLIATVSGALGSGTITLGDDATLSSNIALRTSAGSSTQLGQGITRAITVSSKAGGTVTLGSNGNAANPEFSGLITLQRDLILDGATNADRFTISGGIGGTGSVTIAGTGRVLFVNSANTFTGDLTVNSGSLLQLDYATSTSTSYIPDAALVTVNGTLKLTKGNNTETIGGLAGNGNVYAHDGVANVTTGLVINNTADADFGGSMSNGGASGSTFSLAKSGAGNQTLSGQNSYTGGTSISNGTLTLGHATNTLSNSGAVTLSGGALAIGNNSDTIGALSLTAAASVTGGNGVLTPSSVAVSNTTGTATLSAKLGGSGALNKTGAGALVVSGNSTGYSGAVTLSAGAVTLGAAPRSAPGR